MFTSAKYSNPENTAVVALDEQGHEWQHGVDCQVGDWLRYLDGGGTIGPFVPDPAQQITASPPDLFGGPTTGDVYGHQ